MEQTRWEQRFQAMTHLLTYQTTNPSLHSQLFISSQIPCYLNWDFPPILCNIDRDPFPPLLLRWGLSLFLRRVLKLGFPLTSWRSKCPFQQPPPFIIAAGLESAPIQLDNEQRREYFRKRLRRKRLGSNIHPMIPFLVPNALLFLLLLWNPLSLQIKR
ncbi:uncharacterized protein LOC143851486 [Tasmannia lanceolata]|uniref:uncharacterized protein LOC143851486 n=1 Tax=Tasmannia lanceolata TaxID=3420 RepID=UPI004062A49F